MNYITSHGRISLKYQTTRALNESVIGRVSEDYVYQNPEIEINIQPDDSIYSLTVQGTLIPKGQSSLGEFGTNNSVNWNLGDLLKS